MNYFHLTESCLVKSMFGKIYGFITSSHTDGTLALKDGLEPSTQASGVITSAGACAPATHAAGVLTSSGQAFKDLVKATAVLTSDETNPADEDTVTIGTTVYRFMATPEQAYDVQIEATGDADITLANLVAAINASGTEGVEYYEGTLIHPTVTAGAVAAHATTCTAKTGGVAGNAIAKAETSEHLDWDGVGAVFTGGLEAETITIGAIVYRFKAVPSQNYDLLVGTAAESLDYLAAAINGTVSAGVFTGTPAHPDVVATTNTDTAQTIRGRVPGTSLNTKVTTETCANASFGGETLGGVGHTAGVTTDAAKITVKGRVYTAVITLSETLGAAAIADQVLWVDDEATFLDNFKKAINGAGIAGTNYSTGTLPNGDVVATTNADDAQTLVSDDYGTDGNAITTTTTLANYSFAAVTLVGGTGTTGKMIMSTFTFPTGSGVYMFSGGISFNTALSAVVGGVVDATLIID